MKKTAFSILITFLLASCGESTSLKSGDSFIGIWKNPNQSIVPQGEADFVIDDRILIEPKQDGRYSVSVLARGVFTEMSFNNKKGLLCTAGAEQACFRLQDADTLIIGSETGVITYKRMK